MTDKCEKVSEMDKNSCEDSVHISKRKLEEEDPTEDLNAKRAKASGTNACNLLHLSDDVLLNILQHCTLHDLKALSFCCQRLRILCDDRCLWTKAELRSRRLGTRGLSYYVRRLLPTTTSLCVRGLVGKYKVKVPEKTVEDTHEEKSLSNNECISASIATTCSTVTCPNYNTNGASSSSTTTISQTSRPKDPGTSRENNPPSPSVKENGNSSPKPFSPQYDNPPSPEQRSSGGVPCNGCYYEQRDHVHVPVKINLEDKPSCQNEELPVRESVSTLSKGIMRSIIIRCPRLTEMRLEYCNIDCSLVRISDFPRSLQILSLKASICYNIPMNKSYLFKIQDYMPNLTELDLSWCGWLAAHSLLLLSKVVSLRRLSLRGCRGLGECVAYASLSARYGFKALEVLDVRDTSMGDSETSSFSWISTLRELYMEPPQSDDVLPEDCALPLDKPNDDGKLELWELEPPFEEEEDALLDCSPGPPSRSPSPQRPEPDIVAAPIPLEERNNEPFNMPHFVVQRAPMEYRPGQQPGDPLLPYRPPGIADIINDLIAGNGDEVVAPNSPPPQIPLHEGLPVNEGRVHVIYVNVRRPRARAVRILVAPGQPQNAIEGNADDPEFPVAQFIPNYFRPAILRHVPNRFLVTDASLLRLGLSDNLVHLGNNENGPSVRCCSLHVLVCRGYIGVTDRGLAHLAAAAPSLRMLDVTGTSVTRAGIQTFRDTRPDCKLFWKDCEVPERMCDF